MIVSTMLSLVSCHGIVELPIFEIPENYDPDALIPGSFGKEEKMEISFWAKNENNKTQQAVYRKAVSDFQRLYPNIKVNLKLYSNYNDIYRDVLKNLRTQTTPNICITYPDHIATYNTGKNVIVPLEELMADEKWGLGSDELRFDAPLQSEIVPQFLEEGKIGGVQYALPYMRSTEACYINVDMVKSLGYDEIPEVLTWDWIWEVSEAAMALGKETKLVIDEKTGKEVEVEVYKANGQRVLIPFIYKSTDNMMIQMLEQRGAGFSTEDGEVLIFNEDTKDILYDVAEHTASGAFSTFGISSYPGNYLNKGQCIFAIDSTAGATWMGPEAPQIDVPESELVEFETAVRAIPQYDTENPKMISQGPSICIFNKQNSKEVMASWLFVQYLLTNEVQIAYSQTEGYLPVTTKAHNDPSYKEYLTKRGEDNDQHYYIKIDAAKILLDNLDNTFITPVFNGSANLRNAAGELIEEVAKGVNRKKEINDEFLETLFTNMTKLYHLDEISVGNELPSKIDFDGVPREAEIGIGIFALIWLGIGAYFIISLIKRKKLSK